MLLLRFVFFSAAYSLQLTAEPILLNLVIDKQAGKLRKQKTNTYTAFCFPSSVLFAGSPGLAVRFQMTQWIQSDSELQNAG